MKTKVTLYDCTLRDGAQMAGINFSLRDKYKIFITLVEELGIPYIEVYPSSNVKDRNLIDKIRQKNPEYLRNLSAFGSTRKVDNDVTEDRNLQLIIDSGLQTACIFGKSWDFHLNFIRATFEQNLSMIKESIGYLKEHGLTVFYDAEHFFDGYKSNPSYAIQTLRVAEKAGADAIILCDTNGGSLPHEIYDIFEIIITKIESPLGFHGHHDCGMGNANSIAAVKACLNHNRTCQIQGTFNGLGERTGNANLTTILPVLALKMNLSVVPDEKLKHLTEVSNLIYELANLTPPLDSPFVGYNAFAHKGGMHVAAIEKDFKAYEATNPEDVGNKRRVLVSEMSGRSAILHKCDKFGIQLSKEDPLVAEILKIIKRKESHGYTYEGADASLEILIRGLMHDPEQAAGYYRTLYFEVDYFRVMTDVRNVFREEDLEIYTDSSIKTLIEDESGTDEFHTAADGNGPVNAMDNALRKALIHFYPVLKEIELIDFKVRISNAAEQEKGTASRVRVLVETRDRSDGHIWGTIGSHVNIIVASFVALLDSYVYKLMKDDIKPVRRKSKQI
ncbi:MAG: citramalate synthase [Candidatus Lokiarchaeota archaeon]|nr:citramalate synthase [Candidatus Lokiarchaeota archaeon]